MRVTSISVWYLGTEPYATVNRYDDQNAYKLTDASLNRIRAIAKRYSKRISQIHRGKILQIFFREIP